MPAYEGFINTGMSHLGYKHVPISPFPDVVVLRQVRLVSLLLAERNVSVKYIEPVSCLPQV